MVSDRHARIELNGEVPRYVATPAYWPEFNRERLSEAALDYQSRERPFGRVAAG